MSTRLRLLRAVLATMALACSAPPGGEALAFHDDEHPPKSFNEVVQRLVRASRENLRPLKTFRVEMRPGTDYWYEVEVKLPGAKICRIYEHPRMVYRCEWSRERNAAPVKTVYSDVVRSISEALGSTNWTLTTSSNEPFVTRFEPVNPRREPVFEVRVAGQRNNSAIEVLLFPVDRWGGSE